MIASEFGRDMMVEGKPGAEVKNQVQQPDDYDRAEALWHAPALH